MIERWVIAAAAGVVVAPLLRALIFRHSVEAGQPWRRRCPGCSRVVRWVGPMGRCGGCGMRLGPGPFVVELVCVAVLGLLAWRVPDALVLLAFGWIACLGVALAFVDAAVHRLPDRLTLSAFGGAVVLLALAGEPERLGVALVCSVCLAGLYFVFVLLNPGGMGWGDGKLALSLGLALGWFGGMATVWGAAAGFVLSGMWAAAMLALGRLGRKDSIAHGPFMLMGTLVALAFLV
jgi:leader peptidase (prepilin peptidase)/N-methyltransferase